MTDIPTAITLLRAAGYTIIPPASEPMPASDQPPELRVGQVWVSPKPGVEPRTIVKIGAYRSWDHPGTVRFKTPTRGRDNYPCALDPQGWRKWVKSSGARPVEP